MTRSASVRFHLTPKRKRHLLILVEANAADRHSTGLLLQRLGYDVLTAGTAEQALDDMSVALPSALITGLLLPGMSGMDLIKRIRLDPRTKAVPIIVRSEINDAKVEELCKIAGAGIVIGKPSDPNTLYRALQYSIEATPRHYIRFKTCIRVMIGDREHEGPRASLECITALSEEGLFVRTVHQWPVNTLLTLSFSLDDHPVKTRAIVLYVLAGTGFMKDPGVGMKFVEIADEDRECIRAFILNELTHDLVLAKGPVAQAGQ